MPTLDHNQQVQDRIPRLREPVAAHPLDLASYTTSNQPTNPQIGPRSPYQPPTVIEHTRVVQTLREPRTVVSHRRALEPALRA